MAPVLATRPLRAAAPADRPALARLAAACLGDYGDYAAILRAWADEPGVRTVVAPAATPGPAPLAWPGRGAAEPLLGFAMFAWLRPEPGGPPQGDILAVAVDPEARGSGLGARLLDHALTTLTREAPAVGGETAALVVATTNTAGQALFRAAGFVPDDGPAPLYPNGQRGLRMRRPLGPATERS